MEIQELRNLYLNKILKHINKVNSELTIYNQSNVQRGGSSLASIEPTLDPLQLRFTPHNKSAIDSILKLKTKIEELKINEQKLNGEKLKLEELNKKLNDSLSELNISNLSSLGLSVTQKEEIEKLKQDIMNKKSIILELQKNNSELTARIKLLSDKNDIIEKENTQLNTELENAKKMSEKVQELNSNIKKISKESITSLFTRSKELIQFYYNSSIDVRDKTLELIKEIRQLGKQPKQPEIPANLKDIYDKFIKESYDAALTTETQYDINSFNDKLSELQGLLNNKIIQAKNINDELHLQYEKYLTEKDTFLAELTQSL
jgi:DNA repair exonuclease SbcCD ATPase subunit